MMMIDESELLQYIIINKDLNMSAGKIAAQVGHVCTNYTINEVLKCRSDVFMCQDSKFMKWYHSNQKKIILQAHQKVLEELEDRHISIRDIGCNEVEPGSLTAISLGIMTRREAESIVKRLQIYK